MRASKTRKLLRNGFWLSLLLHLLLFICTATFIFFPSEEKQKPPHYYVPSYVYKGAIAPAQNKAAAPKMEQAAKPDTNTRKTEFAEKN